MSQTYNCNLTQRTTMTKYIEITKLKKKILRIQQIIILRAAGDTISSITLTRTSGKMKFKYIHHRHPHCKVFQRLTELKMPVNL